MGYLFRGDLINVLHLKYSIIRYCTHIYRRRSICRHNTAVIKCVVINFEVCIVVNTPVEFSKKCVCRPSGDATSSSVVNNDGNTTDRRRYATYVRTYIVPHKTVRTSRPRHGRVVVEYEYCYYLFFTLWVVRRRR